MKNYVKLLFVSLFVCLTQSIYAQEREAAKTDSLKIKPKESERNVMLNASSANGPPSDYRAKMSAYTKTVFPLFTHQFSNPYPPIGAAMPASKK